MSTRERSNRLVSTISSTDLSLLPVCHPSHNRCEYVSHSKSRIASLKYGNSVFKPLALDKEDVGE